MRILSIETSCDETAIAILEINAELKILSNVVASQIKIHAKWGGVVPNLAKREHLKNLPIVLKKAISKSGLKNPKKQINIIAVTVGPGLEPSLWTGINFAIDLSKVWGNKSIVGINHMEGHILSVLLEKKSNLKSQILKIELPALALLVSGGHTELVLMSARGGPASGWKYKIIGQTRDDAAGEAFDKVARMLKLPYPGGPEIAKLAKMKSGKTPSVEERSGKTLGVKENFELPRPMINSKNYDFSFSGLKTAVLYLLKEPSVISRQSSVAESRKLKIEICHEFQQAVIDVLISKTITAAKEYKVKTIILGGGVAANQELRKQLRKEIRQKIPNSKFLIPNNKFTTDNAAMIAVAAYFHTLGGSTAKRMVSQVEPLKANGNLTLFCLTGC